MKFPDAWPPPITPATSPTDVLEPGAVNPVRPAADALNAPQQRYRPVPRPPATRQAPPQLTAERRQQLRRGEDRRRAQASVLLDTRNGQDRRQQRRREEDQPPSGINIKA